MSYGSLQNRLAANIKSETPAVGDGATLPMWSDRQCGTVISVSKSGKEVAVQIDKVTFNRTGYAESIEPDPEGRVDIYTRRNDGRWVLKGEPKAGGRTAYFGARNPYYDPHF